VQLPLPREGRLSRFLDCGLPEEPDFVPNEWRSVFQAEHFGHLTIIRDRTGTGKTHLLRWLTHEFRRAGATPLYVSLPSYAGHAREEDILTHVSTHGHFADRYGDRGSAADLQRELAEEERKGMLIILADSPDELFDSELGTVDTRLSSFGHVVLAERCHALPTDLEAACVLEMPRLERDSLDALLTAAGLPAGLSSEAMDEIRYSGLHSNLGVLVAAAGLPQQLGPARQVRIGVEQWIGQRLRATRQVVGQTTDLLIARRLLGILAATEVGLHGPGHSHYDLPAQRIEHALRCLEGWGPRDASLAVLSFLRRTGIVNPSRSSPLLSYPDLCFLLVPEYLAEAGLR
jgi:hypothetical protein